MSIAYTQTRRDPVLFFAHALLPGELSTEHIDKKLNKLGKPWIGSLEDSHEPILWLSFPVVPPAHLPDLNVVNVEFYIFPLLAEHFFEDVKRRRSFGPVQQGISCILEGATTKGFHPYLGFGALTKNATGHGERFSKYYMEEDPGMLNKYSSTHGDAGTVALLLEALDYAGITGSGAKIAVLGATGAIGNVLSQMLTDISPSKLVLIARNKVRLDRLSKKIRLRSSAVEVVTKIEKGHEISSDICHKEDVNVVIVATTGVRVYPSDIPKNSIVFDITTPSACRPEDDWGDTLVLRAGCGEFDNPTVIPEGFGPNGSGAEWDIGAGGENVMWGCALETICRAVSGSTSSHVCGKDIPVSEVWWCIRKFRDLSIKPQSPVQFGVPTSWGKVRNYVQSLGFVGGSSFGNNSLLSSIDGIV